MRLGGVLADDPKTVFVFWPFSKENQAWSEYDSLSAGLDGNGTLAAVAGE
jgi:hypothetical protein